MKGLQNGAKRLPLRHISIRVPWNDTNWTGRVCENPKDNISCLILDRIMETREDEHEERLAGRSWEDLNQNDLPACVSERGSFMAPYEFTRFINHPYAETSEAHESFRPVEYRYPPYSAACIPFKWMLKESAVEKAGDLELGMQIDAEDKVEDIMGFDSVWVQDKDNQLVMLDTFFSALKPDESLCFFYAKRTPLMDDSRWVIIGAGWVTDIGPSAEYNYEKQGELKSVIWERPVHHSIRPDFEDGFLFPYHQVLDYLEEHPDEDPGQYIAFVPDDHFWAFSYASEHVTNDGAIGSLLSCLKAIQNIKEIIPGHWEHVQRWIEERLNELWQMRGPYPGLGSALSAFGFEHGILLAFESEKYLADRDDINPWPVLEKLFSNSEEFPDSLDRHIKPSLKLKWDGLPDERKQLLKLISRFELSPEQAACFYVHEDERRENYGIEFSDIELLENPYLLYELDRMSRKPIELNIVDRGLFPDQLQRDRYPLPNPSKVDDPTDPRRVRAFVIRQLENMANEGHTLYPRHEIIQDIRKLEVQPSCPIDGDLMNVIEDQLEPKVYLKELDDGKPAYQLNRYERVGNVISSAVKRRLRGRRHQENIEWRKLVDEKFGSFQKDDTLEEDARREKTKALEELFASRFSVLLGPAGTGKTSLLEVLLNYPEVNRGGVSILAPTGKARVQLEMQSEIAGGKTIAQFLVPLDRYDTSTQRYHLSNREKEKGAETVVIDEASMLTEEQLAATLDALAGVRRLILVGDPKQLPPIGAGRPFLDIVTELAPENVETMSPKVGQGFAELTINRRQKQESEFERDDMLLAEWFSGRPLDPGADEIWVKVSDGEPSSSLEFIEWENSDELRDKLLDVLVRELDLNGLDDYQGFEVSLGGRKHGEWVYFNNKYNEHPGAAEKVDDWQILSPVRNAPHGVEAINRLIQETFRWKTKESARRSRRRRIPKPMGREGILYGDKVINLHNQRRYDVYPRENALKYVANGEIGIVVGQFKGKNAYFSGAPKKIEVEFSSQPGIKYGFRHSDFGTERDPQLELAYALTVHKVQGSEFGFTILVIPRKSRILSRELLYTGLTRQEDKVIILHQGERHELKKYASDRHSVAAQRLTDLFKYPCPVRVEENFLESGLIHRTARGESVRSKSEVIIAGILDRLGIEYAYEIPLAGKDGVTRYPDFTFEDDETGVIYYLEHLGMLRDPRYKERWQRKLNWYRTYGIIPWDEGGGPEGTLITTEDDEKGGIKEDKIERKIREILNL